MVQSIRDRRDELYDEFLAVPDHLRAEIVNGTLYVSPRPTPRCAHAATGLGGELCRPFQRGRGGPGGWWILDEPELHLDYKQPIVPDLAAWRIERMPALPETAYFTVPPDWVCEVLSRSTETVDRDQKLPYYARHRVRHVWFVDPIDQRLEVHKLDQDGSWRTVRIYQGDVVVRAEPFDAIELELGAMWSAPQPG